MLPHVAAEKRRLPEAERIHAVFGLGDLQFAVGRLDQPAPSGSELSGTGSLEGVHEGVDTAEAFLQCRFQLARHACLAGAHHLPELVVVPMLRGVVEDAVLRDSTRIIGSGDDVFERLAFPFGAGDQLVAVYDIGIVVQVVVIFERFRAHAQIGQRVMRVGQVR